MPRSSVPNTSPGGIPDSAGEQIYPGGGDIAVPSSLTLPTVTGAAIVGQTLQGSAGTWSGVTSSVAYQWYRGAGAAAPIAGASGGSYTVQSADLGLVLVLVVTVSNAAGGAAAQSVPTAVVVAASGTVPQPLTVPTVSGSPVVGGVLTATAATWTNSPALTYQWYDFNLATGAGSPIAGATSPTYLVAAADVGYGILVEVTGTNGAGNNAISSAPTAGVTAAPTAPSTPTIGAHGAADALGTSVAATWSGATVAGSTLVAIVSYFSGAAITPPAADPWVAVPLSGAPPGFDWAVYAIDDAPSQSGAKTWGVGASDSISVTMLEIKNLPSTTQLDVAAFLSGAPGGGNTIASPTLTTTKPDVAIMAVSVSGITSVPTNMTGTGWTYVTSAASSLANPTAVAWQEGVAAGATLPSETMTLTVGGTATEYGAIIITLNQSATAPPAPPPPTSPNPSGVAMPVGNLPGWNQIFADDFTTPLPYGTWPTANACKWTNWNINYNAQPDTTGHGVRSVQAFTVGPNPSGDGSNVPASVLDSWQHLAGANEPFAGQYVSGVCLPNVSGYGYGGGLSGRTYQRVTFAARGDAVPGWKWVPLLWPDSNSGNSEIDFPETDGGQMTAQMSLHFPSWSSGAANASYIVYYLNSQGSYSLANPFDDDFAGFANFDPTAWHVYDQIWTPGVYQALVDEVLVVNAQNGQTYDQFGANGLTITVPNVSMHWTLQTETSTVGGEYPSPDGPAHVQFDWVVIYEQA